MFLVFLLFLALNGVVFADPLAIPVQAESAILMNAETGRILFAKEPFKAQYPASITKLAAALWALKLKGDFLDRPVEARGRF